MRRFFWLRLRGQVYYARLFHKGVRFPWKTTGKVDRDAAEMVAMDWLVNGIPDGKTKDHRSFKSAVDAENSLDHLKSLELTRNDAQRIVSILKRRGLIDSVNDNTT